jgi:TolB protein
MGARAAAAALALAVALALPGGAKAGFPGRDGLIAFTRTVGGERGQVYVVRPDGSDLRQLTHRRNGAGGASWSPDGRRIAFGARAHGELHIFVKRLGGRTRRITPRGANFSTMAWSPDGRKIVTASGHWVQGRRYFDETLVVMRTDGRRPRTVYNGGELGAEAPAWSPDGRTIAFMHTDVGALGASPSIYVVPAAGGEARRITEDSAQDHPDWSPDGSLIAYSYGSALGTDAVRVMRPDGSGDRLLVDDTAEPEGWPAWAPSGERIAFTRRGRIWTVAADGTGAVRVTDPPEYHGDWDPSWQPR